MKAEARRDDWHTTYVGSDIRQLIGEIERLQEAMDRLPKDADGELMVPGMKKWCNVWDGPAEVLILVISHVLNESGLNHERHIGSYTRDHPTGDNSLNLFSFIDTKHIYSSKETAQAALDATQAASKGQER